MIKNNKFIHIKGEYWRFNNENNKINITIKDSYKLIPMALCEFGRSFKLDVKKEIMPYGIYTEENINKIYVNINEAIETLINQIKNKFYNKEK